MIFPLLETGSLVLAPHRNDQLRMCLPYSEKSFESCQEFFKQKLFVNATAGVVRHLFEDCSILLRFQRLSLVILPNKLKVCLELMPHLLVDGGISIELLEHSEELIELDFGSVLRPVNVFYFVNRHDDLLVNERKHCNSADHQKYACHSLCVGKWMEVSEPDGGQRG